MTGLTGKYPARAEREDDEICGKRIFKVASLFAISWAIGMDKDVFGEEVGDMGSLIAEKWLDLDGSLRADVPLPVFGQGRRSCLGKRVSFDKTFMIFDGLSGTFKRVPLEEVDNMAMDTTGFMTEPTDFKFGSKPRGPCVKHVVRREWDTAQTDSSKVTKSRSDVET